MATTLGVIVFIGFSWISGLIIKDMGTNKDNPKLTQEQIQEIKNMARKEMGVQRWH